MEYGNVQNAKSISLAIIKLKLIWLKKNKMIMMMTERKKREIKKQRRRSEAKKEKNPVDSDERIESKDFNCQIVDAIKTEMLAHFKERKKTTN